MPDADLTAFFVRFFVAGFGLLFTTYLIVQLLAIFLIDDRARRAIWVPLPIMAIVLSASLVAFSKGSNMWPLWLIVASPIATIYVAAVWIRYVVKKRGRASTDNTKFDR
jgi:hypothetical protein